MTSEASAAPNLEDRVKSLEETVGRLEKTVSVLQESIDPENRTKRDVLNSIIDRCNLLLDKGFGSLRNQIIPAGSATTQLAKFTEWSAKWHRSRQNEYRAIPKLPRL